MQNEPAGVARFLAWDGEWSFGLGASPGMAWVHPDFTKNKRSSSVPVVKLWLAARENDDFMALVADRAHQLLEAEGGALTDARARTRWQSLNAHIKEAVLAESARWGDAVSPADPRTVDEDWQYEVDRIDALLNDNAALLIEALRDEDYYPDLDPPNIDTESGPISKGQKVSIANPNSKGKLYITTDGTDPRSPGGTLATTAMETSDPVEINASTRIKSRVLVASIFGGQTWSALTERTFYTSVPQLRITEIMYHPAAPSEAEIQSGFTNDDDFEYIVLTNPTTSTIDLKGIQFTDGIQLTAEDTTPLAPGDHTVIVRNAEAFTHRYGSPIRILGTYSRALSNGGERLAITGAFDEPIIDFSYRDDWHENTDGNGSALLLTNLDSPDKAESWQATAPFQTEPTASRPRLSVQQISPTAFTLTVLGEPTTDYELEVSSDLEQWSVDRQMTTTEQATVTADTEETRFYRVRTIAQ